MEPSNHWLSEDFCGEKLQFFRLIYSKPWNDWHSFESGSVDIGIHVIGLWNTLPKFNMEPWNLMGFPSLESPIPIGAIFRFHFLKL